jgi:hypothetical protein
VRDVEPRAAARRSDRGHDRGEDRDEHRRKRERRGSRPPRPRTPPSPALRGLRHPSWASCRIRTVIFNGRIANAIGLTLNLEYQALGREIDGRRVTAKNTTLLAFAFGGHRLDVGTRHRVLLGLEEPQVRAAGGWSAASVASGTLRCARAWTRSLDVGDLTALVERDFRSIPSIGRGVARGLVAPLPSCLARRGRCDHGLPQRGHAALAAGAQSLRPTRPCELGTDAPHRRPPATHPPQPASLAGSTPEPKAGAQCVKAHAGICAGGRRQRWSLPQYRDQGWLLPPGLREWLSEDHLAWFVLEAVAELDLGAFYGAYRGDGWGARGARPVDDGRAAGLRRILSGCARRAGSSGVVATTWRSA